GAGEPYQGAVQLDALLRHQHAEVAGAYLRGQVRLRLAQGQFGVAEVQGGDGAGQLQFVGGRDLLFDERPLVARPARRAHRVALVADVRVGRQTGLDGGAARFLDARSRLADQRAVGQGQLLQVGQGE